MTTQATTQKTATDGKARSATLFVLALGTFLAILLVALLAGTAREAQAALTEKIAFDSNRTTGTGVNNPTGDYEIFKMNPDGTGQKNLTNNGTGVNDYEPNWGRQAT